MDESRTRIQDDDIGRTCVDVLKELQLTRTFTHTATDSRKERAVLRVPQDRRIPLVENEQMVVGCLDPNRIEQRSFEV